MRTRPPIRYFSPDPLPNNPDLYDDRGWWREQASESLSAGKLGLMTRRRALRYMGMEEWVPWARGVDHLYMWHGVSSETLRPVPHFQDRTTLRHVWLATIIAHLVFIRVIPMSCYSLWFGKHFVFSHGSWSPKNSLTNIEMLNGRSGRFKELIRVHFGWTIHWT